MKNLPMDLLRTFVTVVDLGGFTHAGALLGRSQPAISLQIKRLEDLIATPLFQRTAGQRLCPTETGEIVLNYARQILLLNDEVLSRLHKPKVTGCVRIGLPNEFAVSLLPEILGKFTQAHPQVNLEVKCDLSVNLLTRLEKQHEFDLVIAIRQEQTPQAVAPGWMEELVWVTSPNHAVHSKTPLPLIVAPNGCTYRRRMLQMLENTAKPWRIVYTSPNIGGIQAAVMAGLGVTVLAKSTVPAGLQAVGSHDNCPPLGQVEIGLYYARDNVSEAVLHLVDYITLNLSQARKLEANVTPFQLPERRIGIV
ncbi:MAG: LysR substrate-binding domain-containing protein [Candidatus Competibacteraceae bacterium]|jgi:DNA-binding transcriptional LysR family regulator|nr:LysR substrate-binding domain-containing protein [Candidatus Competibacteraceae bacterium]